MTAIKPRSIIFSDSTEVTGLWVWNDNLTGQDIKHIATGGVITGSENKGIYIEGTLNMYGGNIIGNKSGNCGGGVCNNAEFNMYDGRISGNVSGNDGGGVCLSGGPMGMVGGEISENTAGGIGGGIDVYYGLTVGGTAVVKNNIGAGGLASDAEYDDDQIYFAASYEPKDGMYIGLKNFTTIANAKSGYENYFFADDPEKTVKFNTNHLEIVAKSIDHIEVTAPTKTEYLEGKDELDVTGGKVKIYYDNGTDETIDMTVDMVTGFDNTKVGTQTLTVTYEEKTDTFDVNIIPSYILGDVDNNGVVDSDDAIYLLMYTLFPEDYPLSK